MDQTGINYIELTTEPKTPGNPADVANIAINATASSGDVIIGTTGSTRSQAVTIHNATVNGTLEGNANGAHTGTLIGDVVGSIFADDSSVMVDAVNNELTADKVNTQTVEGTSLILLSQSGVNITASTSALMRSLDGDFTIDATGGLAQLTGNGGNASVAVNGDTGQITIGSTHSVTLLGAAGAAVNIGTGTSGTVTLGNGTNTVDFASGSTADFTGATVTGLAANVQVTLTTQH